MRPHLVLTIGLSSLATPAIAEDIACGPVHALISGINASTHARLTNRWLNDGFNNFGIEEVILTEWSQYARWENGPWSVNKREFTPADAASNCAHLGDEIVNGVSTSLYIYDLREYEAKLQVRTWVVKETGLRCNRSSSRWIRRISRSVTQELRGVTSRSRQIRRPSQ